MGKYDELDDAGKSQVDAALEILREDARLAHDRGLLERLDRIEAQLNREPEADPEPTPEPEPEPTPEPAKRTAPKPKPPEPEPVKKRRWGNYADE